ncbi:MAG: RHS repeat domain-containing protein, partial [Bacteroidota bacterium]|nr:RHS repeat domain-containing protein [Bacteroidota bacterium]
YCIYEYENPLDEDPLSYCELEKMIDEDSNDILKYGHIQSTGNQTFTFKLNLKQEYYWVYLLNSMKGKTITVECTVPGVPILTEKVRKIGGLRVKRMTTTDPINPTKYLIKEFEYGDIQHQPIDFYRTLKETQAYECGGEFTLEDSRDVLRISSHNMAPKANYEASYAKVVERHYGKVGSGDLVSNGYIEYNFHNASNNGMDYAAVIDNVLPLNGKIKDKSVFRDDGTLLDKTVYTYDVFTNSNGPATFNGVYFYPKEIVHPACTNVVNTDSGYYLHVALPGLLDPLICGAGSENESFTFYQTMVYDLVNSWARTQKIEHLSYFGNQLVTQNTDFYYESSNHFQPTRIVRSSSTGNIKEEKIFYPDDVLTKSTMGFDNLSTDVELPAINLLKRNAQHRVSQPIQISTQIKDGNSVLSTTVNRNNFTIKEGMVVPNTSQSSKANNALRDEIMFHDYDVNGNPIDVSLKDGPHVLYIWGYDGQYPIAKIENALYNQISVFEVELQTLSSQDDDNCTDNDCSEESLRNALENLRQALPNAMVTTYTYDPLLGVTSITDPKGQTVFYDYDAFGRLRSIKDDKGYLVLENKYNYKG